MKDALAEKLLVRVLSWNRPRVAEELPVLQALSLYKYDEYQQFLPGMRFIESLARWLGQFPADRRESAYQFIRNKLIFCSAAEFRHWVEMAYPDVVRPFLLRQVADKHGFRPSQAPQIASTVEFKLHRRKTLFLGLSDGARVDAFRRANKDLDHEQILLNYELAPERVRKLQENLGVAVKAIRGENSEATPQFTTIVLLDDFSASGHSYYMPGADDTLGGKIMALHKGLTATKGSLHGLVNLSNTDIVVVLYAATDQALEHLRKCSKSVWGGVARSWHVDAVQTLPTTIRLRAEEECGINDLIRNHYDHSVFDPHLETGGAADGRYGYAACGLPLVLHHNTPNNSMALLWSYEETSVRGLFPRIRRHKESP